jgi:hypothetical protein
MGELGALFNPGMRHELEERQSKAARREEEGNARDGDLRIDLESGVAVINVPGAEDEADQPSSAAAGTDSEPGQAADRSDAETERAADGTDPQITQAADQVNPDGVVADPGTTDERDRSPVVPVESAKPAPPVLRPRGKRGLSASTR